MILKTITSISIFLFLFILSRSKFNPMNVVTNPISASDPVLSCRVNEIGIVVNETGLFTVSVSLIDSFTAQIVQNISWQVILKHIERHYT